MQALECWDGMSHYMFKEMLGCLGSTVIKRAAVYDKQDRNAISLFNFCRLYPVVVPVRNIANSTNDFSSTLVVRFINTDDMC